MALIFFGYAIYFCMYSVTVYLVLLFMEKIGRKEPGTVRERIGLAATWAAGIILVQVIVDATKMVYMGTIK